VLRPNIKLETCPHCGYLMVTPRSFDRSPICVRCLRAEWPDDAPRRWRAIDLALKIGIGIAVAVIFVEVLILCGA
jgi:hypothetical protein